MGNTKNKELIKKMITDKIANSKDISDLNQYRFACKSSDFMEMFNEICLSMDKTDIKWEFRKLFGVTHLRYLSYPKAYEIMLLTREDIKKILEAD